MWSTSTHFDADLCALEEQLRLASKWREELSNELEKFNDLIAQLESNLGELFARTEKDVYDES